MTAAKDSAIASTSSTRLKVQGRATMGSAYSPTRKAVNVVADLCASRSPPWTARATAYDPMVAVAVTARTGRRTRAPAARSGAADARCRGYGVHAREPFDGRRFPHETLPLPEPDDTSGEGGRREQHEPVGDHRDDASDHPPRRLGHIAAADGQLMHEQRDPGRDHGIRGVPDEGGDAVAQFGFDGCEAGGLLRRPRRAGVPADPLDGERAGAGDDGAPGHHVVARAFEHGVGRTGQERLVDLQAVRLQHGAVDDDLVPGTGSDDVAEADLVGAGPARTSRTTPSRMLARTTTPKTVSWTGPTARTIRSSTPMTALTRVHTSARTMSRTVRPVAASPAPPGKKGPTVS